LSTQSQSTPRRSRHVFFLDENLGANRLAGILRSAGFNIVTHRERYGMTPGIKDSQIISDCKKHNTILLTADADLETTWAAEITRSKIRAVILSNNKDGAVAWGARIIQGKQAILEQIRKRKKPCVIRLSAQSKVNQVRIYRKKGSRVITVKGK
jgi:predicted nuclease of predicted toxin-antitoxin system